ATDHSTFWCCRGCTPSGEYTNYVRGKPRARSDPDSYTIIAVDATSSQYIDGSINHEEHSPSRARCSTRPDAGTTNHFWKEGTRTPFSEAQARARTAANGCC